MENNTNNKTSVEIEPNNTLYVNRIDEKIKLEGIYSLI